MAGPNPNQSFTSPLRSSTTTAGAGSTRRSRSRSPREIPSASGTKSRKRQSADKARDNDLSNSARKRSCQKPEANSSARGQLVEPQVSNVIHVKEGKK